MIYRIRYLGGPMDGRVRHTDRQPWDRRVCRTLRQPKTSDPSEPVEWDDTEYEMHAVAMSDEEMVLIARPMVPA